MNSHLRVELDGHAQNCAHLIHHLLNTREDLLIDQQGFLLVPANQWDEVQRIAAENDCTLVLAERSKEAA